MSASEGDDVALTPLLSLMRSASPAEAMAEWFRLFFAEANDSIYLLEPRTLIVLDANATATRMLGYSLEELVGRPVSKFSEGVDERSFEAFITQIEGGALATLRTHHVRRSGERVPVSILSRKAVLGGRDVYCAVVRDRSAEVRADDLLHKSNQGLEAMAELARVGAWQLDLDTMTPWFSAETSRIYGLAPGAPPPLEEGMRFYPPEARAEIRACVERAIAKGEPYDVELPFVSADGQRLWVRALGRVAWRGGKPVRLHGALQDITERKRAELIGQALRRLDAIGHAATIHEGIEPMLEAVSVGLEELRLHADFGLVARFDAQGELLEAFELTRGEAGVVWQRGSGGTVDAHFPAGLTRWREGEGAAYAKERWEGVRGVLVGRSGRMVMCLGARDTSAFAPPDGDFVKALTDALSRADERLIALEQGLEHDEKRQQAQRLESIGRLAGGVAHDFNNLLSVILGSSELLRDVVEQAGGDAVEDLDAIDQASGRAKELANRLLAFSRQQVLVPQTLDLNATVRSAAALLRRVLNDDVEVVLRLRARRPEVIVDPTQMDQVIVNLAVNAGSAMPEGGKLTFETRDGAEDAGERTVELIVRDTGSGIPAEVLPHIFDPFFTTKGSGGGGTGLGLAMVHGIVTQSGGSIEATSEPGDGAVFTLVLPGSSARASVPGAAPSARGSKRGASARILVVEDNPSLARVVTRLLRRTGYAVATATTPHSVDGALATLSGEVDLLLTDVVMPGESGPALSARLNSRFPAMRTVFMSGHAPDALRKRAISGAFKILRKPFHAGTLISEVQRALGVA